MQRIMVDLPEPDGPQITMRSLFVTRRLISRSTWKSPYHLCTPTRSTATSVLSGAGFRLGFARLGFARPGFAAVCCAIPSPSTPIAGGEPGFDEPRIARHAVAEDQIEDRG